MSKFGIPVRNGVSVGITAGMGSLSLSALAQAILRSFGNGASEYLFASPRTLWQDAAGTVPATAVNDPIGKATDQINTNSATQTTAGIRPTVQQDGGGRFYASFNGTTQWMVLSSVPFQMADDHAVVICFRLDSAAVNQGVFFGGAGTGWIASIYADSTTGIHVWYWNNASSSFNLVVGTIAVGEVAVVSLRCTAGVVTGRKNSISGGTLAPTGVFTVTSSGIGSHPSLANMSGAIYDLDVIKGTVTDAQLLTLEKAAAQRAGLTI